jgi:hypothetical protein
MTDPGDRNGSSREPDPLSEIKRAASLLGIHPSGPAMSPSETVPGGPSRADGAGALVTTAHRHKPEASVEKLRLGGMALANGLLVHGPTHWAAAVRAADGSIAVASGRKVRVSVTDRIPGLRGIVRLAEAASVTLLVKRRLPEARLPFQNPTVVAVAGAAALASSGLRRRERQTMIGEVAGVVISMAPAVAALRGGELASYHGVEHKAIAAYEQDADDAADASKEHDRCGSHLITPMVASNLVGSALLRRLGDRAPSWAPGAVSLASIGIAVEVFAWSERNAASGLAGLLRRPGHELQRRLGTREPDEHQLEVGRAALAEILRVEGAAA